MRKILFTALVILAMVSIASAIPSLQLFIHGAEYDRITRTWITESGSFDIYVVSADVNRHDVLVNMALGHSEDPGDLDVNFDGHSISNSEWNYGYSPLDQRNGGNDIDGPRNYVELNTGDYQNNWRIGDAAPDRDGHYWDPSSGHGDANDWGHAKSFHVDLGSSRRREIHFDTYTLDGEGRVCDYAPDTHDAGALTTVPEPGSILLLSTGLMGLGAYNFRRKKK